MATYMKINHMDAFVNFGLNQFGANRVTIAERMDGSKKALVRINQCDIDDLGVEGAAKLTAIDIIDRAAPNNEFDAARYAHIMDLMNYEIIETSGGVCYW